MNKALLAGVSLIAGVISLPCFSFGAPPFSGTIFLAPNVITKEDPTTYIRAVDSGRGQRSMYDRRYGWVNENAYLFTASFSDASDVEIQVNPEFGGLDAARTEALKYGPVIGRLPKCIRRDVKTVWIHKGVNPFGGGNENLLIHTGQAAQYELSGILEETLVHEGSHTSLDAEHARATKWLAAQAADGEFISTYARDNPYREDVAESFLLYFALRYRADRISKSLADVITRTIPNRIAYFDSQDFGLSTLKKEEPEADENSWNLATDHGSGWKSLSWFGSYYESYTGWVFHAELGWLYRQSSATDSIWLWRKGVGWIWTSRSTFPFAYRWESSGWIYVKRMEKGPFAYYDYVLGKWVTLWD